jgi:hypothetical protein
MQEIVNTLKVLLRNSSGDKKQKTKLSGLRPQANYADRVTAACRRRYCQLLRIEGVARSARQIPTAFNPCFLDRRRHFFIQVTPQLSSRG